MYAQPELYFDEVIEINLSELEPHINGPFTPDRATPLSEFAHTVRANGWPAKLEVGLIGSCTNSSYEDISRAASIAQQAVDKNLTARAEFTITPGSEQVRFTVERDGFLSIFDKMGGVVLANACGPCIGQWARHTDDPNRKNSIITSFNRNFAKRNDGNPNTHSFVASPEIVTALAIAGDLTFNPIRDMLSNNEGVAVRLDPPFGEEAPPKGYDVKDPGYLAPAKDGSKVKVSINPKSKRLQALSPFKKWDSKNMTGLKLLIKAKGKCTTDHISMAGPWLRFRGHLDNISNNTLTGAVNYFNDKTDNVKNQLTGEYGAVPDTQRAYKAAGVPTIVVGDHNYGEGSSREHAAMQPRHLGIKVILVKSFARIHETNLKKQGMLGLTFANEGDYNKIQEDDSIDIIDLVDFAPDKQLTLVLYHSDGTKDTINANHTYNAGQIEWFKAGSALNLMAASISGEKKQSPAKKKKATAKKVAKKATPKKAAKKTAKKSSKKKAKAAPKKATKKKVTKKAAKKKVAKKEAPKKAVKKKVAKKTAKKVVKKKAAAKKVAKKVAKKAAPKKSAKKVAKKKVARKAAPKKKVTKKVVRKAAKKSTTKKTKAKVSKKATKKVTKRKK